MEETLIVTLKTEQGAEGMARACNLHGQNSVMPCPADFFNCPFELNFRCAWVTARQWEEVAKPQKWGSKERVALAAEVLRQKRMVEWLCEQLRGINDDLTGPPYCPSDECSRDCQPGCAECWMRAAEQAVAEEISPKA